MTLCDTCSKANTSCPIYPQTTQQCVEYIARQTPQQRAIRRYGNLRQLHKYAEECAEAAASVLRWLAEPTPEHYAQMVEEMADVEVCTPYPRLIFGADDIDESVNAKLARLERMNDD